jgi:hypothetical protein
MVGVDEFAAASTPAGPELAAGQLGMGKFLV